MPPDGSPRTRVVVLDLGGVLVELSGVEEFGAMAGHLDPEAVWHTWLHSPAVRRFERGLCDPATFARDIIDEFGLRVSAAQFEQRFATWPGRLYPGALDLVQELRLTLPVACLSNTNALHWDGPMRDFGMHDAFDHQFLSHRMGKLKPDADAFAHVLETLGVDPGEVLFLDDNRINVEGARAVGIDAHRVVGPLEARHLLRDRGIL